MPYRSFVRLFLPAMFLGILTAQPTWAQSAAELWQQETDAAIAAFGKDDYAAAESHMKKALKQAEALGQNDSRYAMSLGDLGAIYYWQERHDEAEPYLKRGLALREELLGPEPATATSAHFLGQIYYARGNYSAAIPLLARALQIREKALGPDDESTLASLDFLAGARHNAGEYSVAIPLFQRLLAARIRLLGADDINVASAHEWLGISYEQTGNTGKAAKHLKRAIEIKAKLSGPDDPGLVWGYAELAGVYQAAGKSRKAEKAFKRELAILEKAHGKESTELLDTLYRMAEFYRTQGREKDAAALQQRYDAISPATSPEGDLLTGFANALEGMAGASRLNGMLEEGWNEATQEGNEAYASKDYEKARERYAKALGMSRTLVFADAKVAISHNNLATAYWALERISEADTSFLQAVDLGQDAADMSPADMKIILGNYAAFLRDQERVKEAESMDKRAAAIP